MIENLIIACLMIALCLVLQCVVVAILLRILISLENKRIIKPTIFGATSVLISVLLIMVAGNLLQITLWAGLFFSYGEFAGFETAFYHSVVNFSTLGYGDIVISNERRLLGAMEAVNGVLMFGLTTGLLYTVLSAIMRRAWDNRMDPKSL